MELGEICRGRGSTALVSPDSHSQKRIESNYERDWDTIQKERANGRSMRFASVFVVSILLATTASVGAISSKGVIACSNSSLDNLPGNWSMPDQSCLRVDLGILEPEESLFFEISSDSEVDILLFPSNTVSVYQNEQSYRIDSVWISESVFESFSGQGEWHWKVPSDRDSTRWYLVIDNLAHPQDMGEGSQGGQVSEVSLDGGLISPQQFTLSDSIHRVESGGYSIVHGPFSVDEGTFVEIHARTMVGEPDIFVMTESAFSYYSPSSNWSSSLRIVSADMLQVSNERYLPWEARDLDGEDLYVIVDNRPGPGGGGAGASEAAVTVTLTLIPVLEPLISSQTNLDSVDVGAPVILSASGTPNKSNQILESGFSWDIDGDGTNDRSGVTTEHHWEDPGNYTVRLSVTSTDSRSASSSRVVTVVDLSPPSVSLSVSEEVTKAFGEQLSISGTFDDNWELDGIDWMMDGEIILSNYSLTDSTSEFTLQVSEDYSSGQHLVSLVVRDKSGMSTKKDVIVNFIDITAPEISQYENQIEVDIGAQTIFQIFAQDDQSEELVYTWIIGQGTDSEIQLVGSLVAHTFDSEGQTNVVCRVENDAGLTSYADILVIVKSSESSSGITWQVVTIFAVILTITILVAALFYYNSAVSRRMEEFPDAEEEQEPPPQPPTPQMQAQMWRRTDESIFTPRENPPVAQHGAEMYDILDVASTPQERSSITSDFEDSLLGDLQPKNAQTNPQPPEGTKIRSDCSSCSKAFEVTLPAGIEAAYTNCPHCGSEELVDTS